MKTTFHAPGIYFGMPEDEYHSDPALGSSSLKRLLASGPDYWWNSEMNPLRPDEGEKAHLSFGRAVHCRVLEGEDAFDRRYMPEPDQNGLLVTVDHLKEFIAARSHLIPKGEKVPATKAPLISLALRLDPEARILDDIKAKAEEAGKKIVKTDVYNRIVTAGAMIARNPHLAGAFSNGVPEVSIFWEKEVDGQVIRCKMRADYLRIRAIGDLKSIGNTNGLEFPVACQKAIASYRYDMQAAHYLDGRSHIRGFVDAGKVFGPHDPAWLAKVAESEECAFVFVFFQSTDAPVTWACSLSPGNTILEYGAISIGKALWRYCDFMKRYGRDTAWVLEDPVAELDVNDLPNWYGR